MIIGLSGKIGSGKNTVARIIQGLNMSIDYDILRHHIKQEEDFDSSCGWEIKAFADKLKEIVSLLTGIPRKDLDKTEVKNSLLPDEWQSWEILNWDRPTRINSYNSEQEAKEFCKMASNSQYFYTYKKTERTVRWILQYIGTDLFRNQLHQNVHINALFADYKPEKVRVRFGGQGVSSDYPIDDFNKEHGEHIYPNWIVTDNRFPNECKAIKDRGGILIRINRKLYYWKDKEKRFTTTTPFVEQYEGLESDIETSKHLSETSLDNYDGFDYEIDNDKGIPELIEKVKEILIKEKII